MQTTEVPKAHHTRKPSPTIWPAPAEHYLSKDVPQRNCYRSEGRKENEEELHKINLMTTNKKLHLH